MSLITALRPTASSLPESLIVRVFNHGRHVQGLIPLWAGEGDIPTPAFIHEAAAKALANGDTFYMPNRGIPELRASIAGYHQRLFGQKFVSDEFFVTAGGMQAIQLAVQAIAGVGDEVIVPTPAWPNFRGALECNGATAVAVPMSFSREGWALDLDALFRAVTPKTRAIVVNSPSNPTGWTATEAELRAILDFTRTRGLWIIADEIYMRFTYGPDGRPAGLSPSLQTLRAPTDRIVFAQTFSKNWAMTGWRLGWLQAPAELGQVIENLVQYNTSGVAPFLQRAGVVALEDGEEFARGQIERAAEGRRIVTAALASNNGANYVPPKGAFYAFFGIDGVTDSLGAAMRLIDEAKVGLAPGSAFGDAGAPYFRVCFLRDPKQVADAMSRLSNWLKTAA
jgi:aspartate/methionine/tyrosine aminotransferase